MPTTKWLTFCRQNFQMNENVIISMKISLIFKWVALTLLKNRTPGSECCLYLNLGSYTRAGVQYVFVFVFKYTNISICICILKPTRRNICICIWLAYLGVFDKYFFKYTFHFYTLFQQKLIIHPHVLVLGYCVHIWQMSLQLSCGDS